MSDRAANRGFPGRPAPRKNPKDDSLLKRLRAESSRAAVRSNHHTPFEHRHPEAEISEEIVADASLKNLIQ